jgi:hypothetical protein
MCYTKIIKFILSYNTKREKCRFCFFNILTAVFLLSIEVVKGCEIFL